MALLSLPHANNLNLNLNLVAFSSKPLSLSSKSKPQQSLLHLPHHHFNQLSKNNCSGSNSFNTVLNYTAPKPRRRSLKTSLSFQDSPLSSSNDDEESSQNAAASERKPDQQQQPSFKTLTKAYKEALLIRDMETAAEIESIMYTAENEKNVLVERVSALSAEITSGKEKYIRLQADFDNFRKRSEKERLTIRSDAQGEVIESLLPMVDNFERAKQQIKPETEMEKKINVSYQGIYKQFVEIMRSLRVSAVATVGKPFDPSLHEAIAREESQEFNAGIITQEFRRGFILGDRLLRPAMVKVSSGPGPAKMPPPASEKSSGKFATASIDE